MAPGIDFKKMNENLRKRLARYDKEVQKLLDDALKQLTAQVKLTPVKVKEPFEFSKYPSLQAKKDKLLKQLSKDIQTAIVYRQDDEWGISNRINDALVDQLAKTVAVPSEMLKNAYSQNAEALVAFQGRKVDGLSLSDRVWNITQQFDQEMGIAIDAVLLNGTPASQLSREVRGLLKEPNRLFRRVRDARGALHLSKAAKAYHPGRGVYRSSYKNAQRLARTEITMAYRTADYTRYQQLDFIVGFEVHLSESHPQPDICDNLKGNYPKDFKFGGWHPQCLCYMTTILATPEELEKLEEAIISGNDADVEFEGKIKEVPAGMQKWINDNKDRSKGWRSQPYFVRDNFVGGKLTGGLRIGGPKPVVIIPPAKVPPAKAAAPVKEARVKAVHQPKAPVVPMAKTAGEARGILRDQMGFNFVDENIDLETLNLVTSTLKPLMAQYPTLDFRQICLEVKANTYGSSESKIFGTSGHRLNLNPTYFKSQNYANFNKQLTKDLKVGWHPRNCGTAKAVIEHEYGHLITSPNLARGTSDFAKEANKLFDAYKTDMGAKAKALDVKYQRLSKAYFNVSDDLYIAQQIQGTYEIGGANYVKIQKAIDELLVKKQKAYEIQWQAYQNVQEGVKADPDFVSNYATKNVNEFTAECFSQCLNDPAAGKYAKGLFNLINTYFKK